MGIEAPYYCYLLLLLPLRKSLVHGCALSSEAELGNSAPRWLLAGLSSSAHSL